MRQFGLSADHILVPPHGHAQAHDEQSQTHDAEQRESEQPLLPVVHQEEREREGLRAAGIASLDLDLHDASALFVFAFEHSAVVVENESCGHLAGREAQLDAQHGGREEDLVAARDVEERRGVAEAGGRLGGAEVEGVRPGARVAVAQQAALVERGAAEVLPLAAGRAGHGAERGGQRARRGRLGRL